MIDDGQTASPPAQHPQVMAVIDAFFECYPNLARRAGRPGFEARLPKSSLRDPARFSALAAAAFRELRVQPPNADRDLIADLATVARLADTEALRADALGETFLVPVEVLAETDLTYYTQGYSPLLERVTQLETHLQRLPEFLRNCGETLPSALAAGVRLSGIEQANAQARSLVASVESVIGTPEVPTAAAARLRVAASRVAEACHAYADQLQACRPVPGLLGADRLQELLLRSEGIDEDPWLLLAEAEDELANLDKRATQTLIRLGTTRGEGLDLLAHDIGPAPLLERMSIALERAQTFWQGNNLLTPHVRRQLQLRVATEVKAGLSLQFWSAPPLAPLSTPHLLQLPAARSGQKYRDPYLNDSRLAIAAIHEGIPGHYLHAESVAAAGSMARTCFAGMVGATEGWAHYCEHLAMENGFGGDRPMLHLAQIHAATEAALRLYGHIALHVRATKFTSATQRAVGASGWSQEQAAREMLAAITETGPAMYALGALRLRRWRTGLTGGTVQQFHDRILRCGHAPLSVVHDYAMRDY